MKRLNLLLSILLVAMVASAEKVTHQVALQKAQQFMQDKQLLSDGVNTARRLISTAEGESTSDYYIFNVENNGGFVIVAGDDRLPEILGYSEHGNLNDTSAPSNVKWLLDYYKFAAKQVVMQPLQARSVTREVKSGISPLMTTKWDQGAPYYNKCPEMSGKHCLTGCVATAMAQVINYHRWPVEQTRAVGEYVTGTNHITMPELPPTAFHWDNMTNEDIARLMLYCGQALQMDYGLDESGASPSMEPVALSTVFNYSQSARLVQKSNYADEDWENLLYKELAERRPVIYNGYGDSGGHTFVVHGYEDGKFYINWGWGGNFDGYFQLTNLTAGESAFNNDQSATISIKPKSDETGEAKVIIKQLWGDSNRYSHKNEDGSVYYWLSCNLASDLSEQKTMQVGVGLYKDNVLQRVLCTETKDFPVATTLWVGLSAMIDKDVTVRGDCRFLLICRETEDDEWLPCLNSEEYYVDANISDYWLRAVCYPMNDIDRNTIDYGLQLIDGINYYVYCENGKNRAKLYQMDEGRYSGDIFIPDAVKYNGEEFFVMSADWNSFNDSPRLTSLSFAMPEGPSIQNCMSLKTLEVREGVNRVNIIWNCDDLESLEFPKSVNSVADISECGSLETIRFNNPDQMTFTGNQGWNTNNAPALADVYFASPEPPVFTWDEREHFVHPTVTLHVPEGMKEKYENAGWTGYKIEEDQPLPKVEGIEWGYCTGNEINGGWVYTDYGENDVDYAIHVPAEMLKPYKGKQITRIEFYTETSEYVFITKPGTDYLVKEPVTNAQQGWNKITLSTPYTISDGDLYVGLGCHSFLEMPFTDMEKAAPDGFWIRPMGTDTSWGMEPGVWDNVAARREDLNHPLPIRFIISGDDMPYDMVMENVQLSTGSSTLNARTKKVSTSNVQQSKENGRCGTFLKKENQDKIAQTSTHTVLPMKARVVTAGENAIVMNAKVQSRTLEIIKNYTISWTIDGEQSGSKQISTTLLPNETETVSIDIPATLVGRSHTFSYSVSDINGHKDAIPSNSEGSIDFNAPASHYFQRKVVMEEGTGTWCGWCVRGIESIERLNKQYPDNFIAIGLHTGDEMQNPLNYDKIVNQFLSFPSANINRTQMMDPSYEIVAYAIEELRDKAEAQIKASALFATQDSSSVAVTTESTFGFSDFGADFRIAYVVVEDQVGPYMQNNYYSDPNAPDNPNDYMNEWVKKASKVKVLFNDVARAIYSDADGVKQSVPETIVDGEVYKYRYSFALPKNIQNKHNIRIVTLLVDNKTGEIINADQTSIGYDKNIENYTFGFAYENSRLADDGTVVIEAEEDELGTGMACGTNPANNPKRGLVVTTFDGSKKSGKATLEIVSNTLDAQLVQWCMGGDCVPIKGKAKLEKAFTTDNDGVALVQLEASEIQSKGALQAKLTVTFGDETHTVNIQFANGEQVQEPSSFILFGTPLLTNKKYTSKDFNIIKSGSFKISKDGSTLSFNDLVIECLTPESAGCLFEIGRDATILLNGKNDIFTAGHYVVSPYGNLTITGDGSLTTKSSWYDFWVHGYDLIIDNTTLVSDGGTSIGNNGMPSGDNIVVIGSTFKGRSLFRLSSFVLLKCAFSTTQKIVFDPTETNGTQLKYSNGTFANRFTIEPIEGDFDYMVTPSNLGNIYLEAGKTSTINVTMQNNGLKPVSSVSYVIRTGGIAGAEQTYKLSDEVSRLGEKFDVPVLFTGAETSGAKDVVLTVTKVSGKDNTANEKSATGSAITVSPVASHRVVVEEFTGSWCGWCTRGIVGLDLLNKEFGDNVITIAAHASDPMFIDDYNFIFNLTNSYPSCVINRGDLTDPYYGTSGSAFGIASDVNDELSKVVPGSIEVGTEWADANKSKIKITTSTTFGYDATASPYQIGFILLADGLKGSGSEWAQNNVYAGASSGDANLRTIENLPGTIVGMEFDHVAVAVWGADKGLTGSIKVPIRNGVSQTFVHEVSIAGNQLVQDKERLSMVALLLDKATGKIINAAKCGIGQQSSPDIMPNTADFEFKYQGRSLSDSETVTIDAEKDSWGFGEMNCETNPSDNPKNGLILVTKNGAQSGTAKLEILSNTLNATMIQWCMGGECVPMTNKSSLEKNFVTDKDGVVQVQFDATNIKSAGSLDAKLTATVGSGTRVVYIKFVYDGTNGLRGIYSYGGSESWFDMNGMRLNGEPNRKGVYILNGKKIVK